MANRITRFLIVLVLAGCDELADEQTEGPVLATLQGTISLGPDVEPPVGKLQVSVLWQDPTYGRPQAESGQRAPLACDDGMLTGWLVETPLLEQPVRVDTNFPSGFSVRIAAAPPAAALFQYPDIDVSVARGELVVYDDRNGNGRLDPSTVDKMSPDLVLGSSKGSTPWGIGQRIHYNIVYLTDDLEDGEGDRQAGFSLVTTEPDQAGERILEAKRLSDAKIDLVLEPTRYVQQVACSVMCSLSGLDWIEEPYSYLAGDVGMRVPSELGVGTSVWSQQDGDATTFSLARCSKQDFADYRSYTLELDVVRSEGCTQISGSWIDTTATNPDTIREMPCDDIRDVDESDFPQQP